MTRSKSSESKDEFQRQFQFIDDRERMQNPVLRRVVRSAARKHSYSTAFTRRAPTGSILLRRLERAPDPASLNPYSEHQKPIHTRRRSMPTVQVRKAQCESSSFFTSSAKGGGEIQRQPLLSPQTVLRAGTIDPFYSLPVKMQPYMYGLLENYISILCWKPNDKIHDELSNTHQKWFQVCMDSEMTLKTILSMSESGSRKNRGLNPWSPLATTLMVDAYALLNKKLNNPKKITDSMFATVVNMAAVELVSRNYSKYQNHINGLKEMVRLRGGLSKLDDYIKRMIARVHHLGGNIITDDGKEWTAVHQPEQKPGTPRVYSQPQSPASSDLLKILKVILALSQEETPLSQATSSSLKCKLLGISGDPTISTLEQTTIIAASIYIDFILHGVSPKDIKWNSVVNRELVLSTMQLRSKRDMDENGIVLEWVSAVARTTFFVGLIDWDPERQRVELIEKLKEAVKRLEGRDGE
ncbi:hypothetical protein N431DRAFT_520039 [Stipitochalara longipes BDJ]|nr:hypothetical protein N431DRAFT_520039 [Stipitochalara longipes BDJ]